MSGKTFGNAERERITATARVLKKHQISMKQFYPAKELRHQDMLVSWQFGLVGLVGIMRTAVKVWHSMLPCGFILESHGAWSQANTTHSSCGWDWLQLGQSTLARKKCNWKQQQWMSRARGVLTTVFCSLALCKMKTKKKKKNTRKRVIETEQAELGAKEGRFSSF